MDVLVCDMNCLNACSQKLKKEEEKENPFKSIFRNVHIFTEELICVNAPWS